MDTHRINEMEQRLGRAAAAVDALEAALDQYEAAKNDLAALNAYLGSPEWHADRADDEAGRLPQDLKRGVLSEDAIWNLMEHAKELTASLTAAGRQAADNTTFRPLRRIKQQMSDEECIALLEQAPRGILAVLGDGGYPYTVPLDFLYADCHLYFHCAKQGHKLDAIRAYDKSSFCVLSDGVKEPDSWWYHFQSVVCFGRIHVVEDPARTDVLLRQLGAKYFPEGYDLEGDMSKNAPNALVLDMQIEHLSGKRVREK